MTERRLQKRREGLPRHLADAHGELAMADAAEPADMPIDRNVVRWIGEEEVGTLTLQQAIEGLTVAGIAAQETMTIGEPQVFLLGHRRAGIDQRRYFVFRRFLRMNRSLPRFVEHKINLGGGEAGDLHIEFEIDKGLQFRREQLAIPAGVQDELVVGEDVSPALRRIEVGEANRRDALQAYELGCLDPAMSGDDLVIIADQHRIGEAELLDAVGDLPELLLRVGAGVSRVRSQACDRHIHQRDAVLV